MKIIERLETLRRLNRDPNWVNDDIFRLVSSPQLAVLAYERIKSKAGNMTAGDDNITLDEISLQAITDICESVRNGSYMPKPVRRKHIPKANGKLRPLGIPSPRDKIVQEMVREILESIYDGSDSPTFSDHSHGFRPRRSCHTSIREFTNWQGVKWLIEGDIVGFFDNIDHQVLIDLLRKRIKDERFINLIWKFLRAGVREENGQLSHCKLGTPQGGIISPIFSNIYLHEFDLWVQSQQDTLNKGSKRKANPVWRSINSRRARLLANGAGADSEEIKRLERLASTIPSIMVDDPDFCRVFYTRYADDWVIGVVGDKALAESLKQHAATFLRDVLKIELSHEKTLITHAKEGSSQFLSFRLLVGESVRRTTVKAAGQRASVKRTTGWQPRVDVPVKQVVAKLQAAGYCQTVRNKSFFPCSKKAFVALEDHEIVMRFNSIWRGIYNYYCVCDNAYKLNWVMYLLQYSCLMTLSHKHRARVPKTIRKLGVFPKVAYKLADGQVKEVQFWRPTQWKRAIVLPAEAEDVDLVLAKAYRLTRTHLNRSCVVCDEASGVEMHHVRALRKGNKSITSGFNRIMSAINRKQVPLCGRCHAAVHAGKYDGIRLTDLAYIPQ
jgi:group II intron reverse transcriptase/maturase